MSMATTDETAHTFKATHEAALTNIATTTGTHRLMAGASVMNTALGQEQLIKAIPVMAGVTMTAMA
jgi:hypothetical protein